MIPLTPRQQQCLSFIRSYHQRYGCSPSFANIAEAIGVKSGSGVHELVHGLAHAGAVKVHPRRKRGIELVEPGEEHAVSLSREIHGLLLKYAAGHHIAIDTAANELLRQALGADR